jgi:hypothetical protein
MPHVLAALLIASLCWSSPAPAADARVQAIAPFIDREVIAVLHLDLAAARVDELLPRLVRDQDGAAELSQRVAPWFAALRQAGARELFLILSPTDLPGTPSVVAPLGAAADAPAIGKLLCGGGEVKPPFSWPTCATLHHAVFAGTPDALERARRAEPVALPEMAAALAAAGDSAAQLLILPASDYRRVVEEMQPNLPRELGGGPITPITRGLVWVAIGLETQPRPVVRLVIQAHAVAAARALRDVGHDALRWLEQSSWIRRRFPDFAKIAEQIKPTLEGDRVVLNIDLEPGSVVTEVLYRSLRESHDRSRCVDNLKQIGLALHGYHDIHKAFPPAYSRDTSGRPLLSWRVLILPFLEQDALYREFHLDEPWDSPHNRTLIDKIPAVYRCPAMSRQPADRGKTTYLGPRGKATVFSGAEGIKISEITDGTSNTIFAIDAGDDRAVTWTRPDDWEVEPELEMKGLFGHHPEGTVAGFLDGWALFLRETIKPETLKALVTRNGGEVVTSEDY